MRRTCTLYHTKDNTYLQHDLKALKALKQGKIDSVIEVSIEFDYAHIFGYSSTPPKVTVSNEEAEIDEIIAALVSSSSQEKLDLASVYGEFDPTSDEQEEN